MRQQLKRKANTYCAWCTAMILMSALAPPSSSTGQERNNADAIPKLLFDTYIAGHGRISSSTVLAASHIIAESGRPTGYWKEILATLKSTNDQRTEVGCVRILGQMLGMDAASRDAIQRQNETGQVNAMILTVYLGKEVAAELLRRGQQADRFRIDHYVIALARGKVPEAKDFFAAVMSQEMPPPNVNNQQVDVPFGYLHLESTRYHAAVGLANLNDFRGIEWLIANSPDTGAGHVSHARPYGASRGGSLSSCCVTALQQLADNRSLTTHEEWQRWWSQVDRSKLKLQTVVMEDL